MTSSALWWVLSGGGGFDLPTDQPWLGAELALHPTGPARVAPTVRLAPAFGLGDRAPLVFTEVGVLFNVPEDEATLRVGAALRDTIAVGRFRMPEPLAFGDPVDGLAVGVLPGVLAIVEFEWNPDAPFVLALRGGPVSTASDYACNPDAPDRARCITWSPGFGGGAVARKRFRSGVAVEASFGTTSWLTVGHAL